MIRHRCFALFSCLLLFYFVASAACQATIILSASGTSAKGVDVTFEAQLTISGDMLTVKLVNDSPGPTLNPDDALGSLYFDILDGGNNRPMLVYSSATGDVYLGDKNNPDSLDTANADLKAVIAGDNTWQFKAMDDSQSPFLGFGIGTVGNSNLAPNNFMGNIVDGIDYSIYKGDISTSNLDGKLLVKDMGTFTFTGAAGFTEADIVADFAFGLGTAPDSLLSVPEPSGLLLTVLAILSVSSKFPRRTAQPVS